MGLNTPTKIKSLSDFIVSNKNEIADNLAKKIKTYGGSYAQVDEAELRDLSLEFVSAFLEVIEKGNYLKLRIFVEKVTRTRSEQGFRLSEVQRAYYSFYYVVKEFIAKNTNKLGFMETINSVLIETLFELSESFHKRLNTKLDNYVREVEDINLKLKQTSIHDSLTGCYNRRYFDEALSLELSKSKRYERPLLIILFDIDHFKDLNDKFGHPFGDTVLKKVVNVISKSSRVSDMVFRYGGEEISVVLPETSAEGGGNNRGAAKRESIKNTF